MTLWIKGRSAVTVEDSLQFYEAFCEAAELGPIEEMEREIFSHFSEESISFGEWHGYRPMMGAKYYFSDYSIDDEHLYGISGYVADKLNEETIEKRLRNILPKTPLFENKNYSFSKEPD